MPDVGVMTKKMIYADYPSSPIAKFQPSKRIISSNCLPKKFAQREL